MSRELRPHQIKAIDGLRSSLKAGFRRPLLFLPTGAGKCLGIGTPVLMHDGSVKNVEDVVAGDVLMGPLSEPKTVLSTCRGEGELFRIVPTKGEPWVCNDVHVLTLVETQTGEVIDIPLDEYLTRSKTFKHVYKQFSPPGGIDFPVSEAGDPSVPGYFLGVWAGDGTKRLGTIHVHKPDQEIEDCCRDVAEQFGCQMTRREQRTCPEYAITTARGQANPLLRAMRPLVGKNFIHQSILVASRDYRLQFLAGILDTDGYLTNGCFEVTQKSRVYADAIVFISRSLGLKACCKPKIVNGETYWRVHLSGDTHRIPTRIPRKQAAPRQQIKVATRTGFKVEPLGRGEYAGFELDGDGRFLLGDFTVTHNTRCAGEIVKGARAKGKRVLFVVPAISLIDQTVRSFWAEGITDIGVIQGQHPMTRPEAPVQVASIQTLQRRAIPPFDIVVIDEAHVLFDMLGKWMAAETWQKVPFIGLSATPWTRGLGKHYDDLIQVTTTAELIEAGYLSPFRVYAPSHPDLGGVRTVAGDYHEGDLSEAMNKPALVADVVTTWRQRGENRPTFVFAVDRAHAKHLQGEFEKAGIGCGYIDAFTKPDEREAMFRRFSAGELRVIASVGCLTTGVDLDVRCIVLCRPTRSEMLYCQLVGRGLRTAKDHPVYGPKRDLVLLDHSDTTLRLGFVTDIHHDVLDDGRERQKAERREKPEALPKECSACNFLKPAKTPKCPACGFKPERQSDIQCDDGELVEMTPLRKRAKADEKAFVFGQLRSYAKSRRLREGWASHKFKEMFGVWPNAHRLAPDVEPTPEILSWIKSRQIAFANRRNKEPTYAAAAE